MLYRKKEWYSSVPPSEHYFWVDEQLCDDVPIFVLIVLLSMGIPGIHSLQEHRSLVAKPRYRKDKPLRLGK